MESTKKPENSLETELRFRPAGQEDVAFIFHSWLKCYRHAPGVAGISSPVYYAQHHLLIEGLCRTAKITMVCAKQDPTQLFGYICYDTAEGLPVLHFIYVKETYRRMGIAHMLCKDANIE